MLENLRVFFAELGLPGVVEIYTRERSNSNKDQIKFQTNSKQTKLKTNSEELKSSKEEVQ